MKIRTADESQISTVESMIPKKNLFSDLEASKDHFLLPEPTNLPDLDLAYLTSVHISVSRDSNKDRNLRKILCYLHCKLKQANPCWHQIHL